MKIGTNKVLVTCFRHLAGRSAASPQDLNIGSNAELAICHALTPKLRTPKLLNFPSGPIRRKSLILAEFAGFLSNLQGKKISFRLHLSFPFRIKSSADSRRKYLISLILPGSLTSFLKKIKIKTGLAKSMKFKSYEKIIQHKKKMDL